MDNFSIQANFSIEKCSIFFLSSSSGSPKAAKIEKNFDLSRHSSSLYSTTIKLFFFPPKFQSAAFRTWCVMAKKQSAVSFLLEGWQLKKDEKQLIMLTSLGIHFHISSTVLISLFLEIQSTAFLAKRIYNAVFIASEFCHFASTTQSAVLHWSSICDLKHIFLFFPSSH